MLARLPAWATTGVGSLPHDDVEAAVTHVTTAYDVPFCPQLPRLEGDMVTEWLGADPRRCGWSPDRDRERPRAWDALLARLESAPPPHRVVKLQVTGPVTLAHALATRRSCTNWRSGSRPTPPARWARCASAGSTRCWSWTSPPCIWWRDRGVERAWESVARRSPPPGDCTCAGRCRGTSSSAREPDVLSFDLTLAPPDERVLGRLVARGGRIAWGVIPPHRRDHVVALPRADGAHSLLTASCGTGRMSLRRELEIAETLRSVRPGS